MSEIQSIRAYRELGDENGNPVNIYVKMEVCPVCRGRGEHSRNLGAFSADEMDEMGDEFRQDYIAGNYNATCDECKGLRVVEVLDREATQPSVVALIDKTAAEFDAMYDEERREREAGA